IDCAFSHEVLGEAGRYFTPDSLPAMLNEVRRTPEMTSALRDRVRGRYQWEAVAEAYLRLAEGKPGTYCPTSRQSTPVAEVESVRSGELQRTASAAMMKKRGVMS
ncbi:MAG: hypothetical protein D6800_07665, partial [Candidatus Zixiibacteriota bacterium]